jgi:hypothetical protein
MSRKSADTESRMPRLLSRPAKLLLFVAMAVCLPIALASEAVALVFDSQTLGNEVGTAADVFGWLFAVVFLTVFILAIIEQDRAMRARQGPRSSPASH